mgnify:CR=1 FL=1
MSLRRKNPALVIGSSAETAELIAEMARNPRVGLFCREKIAPEELSTKLIQLMESGHDGFQYVVADLDDPRVEAVLPELYRRFFGKATIIDLHELYEDIFDLIPLSRMDHGWIMSQISLNSPKAYDAMKRSADILLSVIVGVVCLVLYPFTALAIKLETKGPALISQERIGKKGDVLIWHGRLVHRGSPPAVPGTIRHSFIAHYTGINHWANGPNVGHHPDGGMYFLDA